MTFDAPDVTPPIRFPNAPLWMKTPSNALPSAAPDAFVPMKFPWTLFDVAPAPAMSTPYHALPDRTLAAPDTVPPTVLPGALRATPENVYGSALVPAATTPM